ncbi:MAG: glycoside hydrolase family 3 C-terminal domain-containing protein [Candidatus Nanopelagicales bacterium]
MDLAALTDDELISLLSGADFWHTQSVPGLRSVLVSDGPHGLRVQDTAGEHLGILDSAPATCFPPAVTLASSWDEELLSEVGAAVGAEALAAGVAVVLGPGLNIKRHPRCGRNFEYFSEDPLLAGRFAAAMVNGIQSTGVGACLKHFAVNNQESHRFVVDAVLDERTLREIYLAGFEYAVTHSAPRTVMASYNLVNGTYACDNHRLLTEILRDEWGFDGLVMSDWGATNDRVAGVLAGMDLEMPGSAGAFDPELRAALADGRLTRQDLQRCAERLVALVERSPAQLGPAADFEAHDALARRAAAESSVLLTNDGTLPLEPGMKLALIGAFAEQPRFQGSGSSLVNAVKVTTLRDALHERGVEVTYAPGYNADGSAPDPRLLAEAVTAAEDADVVVVMAGLPGTYESEGFDRDHLHLPAEQDTLITAVSAVNPRTVVVLSNGSPVLMPWVDAPAAILEPYLGGQASGAAVADVLFGDVEPGGRLAETFPLEASDVASDAYFPGAPHQVEYREGLAVGYRQEGAPLFAFGHGLGYSTFDVGAVAAEAEVAAGEDAQIVVPVSNTGTRDGSTVLQVYRHDRTGRVPRPRRELVAFAKVRLAAGESRDVSITVPARGFAFWHDGWQIPQGEHALEIGWSSADIRQTVAVTITGGFTGTVTERDFVAPTPRPVRPYSRVSTIGELSGNPIGKILRQIALRVANYRDSDPATQVMIKRAVEEMPMRGMALFSQGKVSLGMVDALADLANRRPDRVVRSFAGWATRLLAKS